MSVATAERVRTILAEKLGVEPTHEAFAAIPNDRLMMAQTDLKADLVSHLDPERWGVEVVTALLPWQPVIDGDTIPTPPLDRIVAGTGADIDLLIGTNTDEHRLFLASTGALGQITDEALAAAVVAYGLRLEETFAAYRAAHPGASSGDLLAAIQTDWYWRIPAIRLADAHAKNSSATWMYEFAWRSPQFGGFLGACHSLEIAFVFDTLGCETEPLLGPTPPQQLAGAMHGAWVAFATSGDPGWPRYDLSRRATMRFDTTSRVVDDPLTRERTLWEGMRD
jgi:carboxylesterase 2/para-nitrobenzyl esterase